MGHFKLNARGGLSVDRDSLHASSEFKRQIEALSKLSGNPMTLPQNVADAVKNVAQSLRDTFIEEDIVHEQVAEIRAHLMSQEAEIELLSFAAEQNLSDAKLAESRIAAANALLRDTLRQWPSLSCDAFHHRKSDQHGDLDECEPLRRWRALYAEIQSHLQGAGDEA